MSDRILLPVLALLTIGLLTASTVFIGQWKFSESTTTLNSCLIVDDDLTGPRGVPNSVCQEKAPETSWIEYRFDNCGYRTVTKCGPKKPGTYRIVMTGSSVAMGSRVRIEDAFGTLLPEKLLGFTKRRIEVYNEAISLGFVKSTALRFNDVIKAQPDLVLWIVTPLDLEEGGDLRFKPRKESTWTMVKEAVAKGDLLQRIRNRFDYSPAGFAIQHFLIESESPGQYIRSFLERPDQDMGFLRKEYSPQWKQRIHDLDATVAAVAARARAAGVPLVVTLLPNRAQAAMISTGYWPQGYDPYRVESEVRSRVISQGGIYLETFRDFRQYPGIQDFFYPVDGHPDSRAHAIFADVLARHLTSGAVADLEPPRTAELRSATR
jgi:hypothetical protein